MQSTGVAPVVQRGGVPIRELKTMTVAGYARQSEEELRQGKRGMEEQAAKIRSCSLSRGWNLSAMYEDVGHSGDDLNRLGLLELLARRDVQVLVVDTTDRLTSKKRDLDFLLALLDKQGITCVPATWSWDYLAQYMRHWYRARGNLVYALLDECEA